ncbi:MULTISPECIES: EamA family transporter [Salinivibrio]|uniref:EamA family transporter n=1 Tax=Salinivibrio kushneri TaxID=1908198 RepID=A0AB36K4G5_9GAMM|nr:MULTISPECIES: EamA family transporter [Salinivibrio]ODP96103.1 permease [Salinivibrio sp. BNH]OOE32247.1 EamA family transporter [Salinivibrio kushneri]OOE35736.1 EamA family transporter [Salinivibrio kushneri]OOE38461.1 EamA family transporter [Salinivibrio kushneri]OOE42262.1 EamA family transporter [Salinivibrio kushneri]
MNIKSVLLALLVVLIWGVNFSVIKVGLETLPPILFSGLRFFIVALPAVFFIPRPKVKLWQLFAVGLSLGVIKFSLLFIAMQDDASAGIASLLLQSQVIFTIALSALLLKEHITLPQRIGLAVAFVGFGLFFVTSTGSATLTGVAMIVAAGFFWAIANMVMKQMPGVNLMHFMVWVSLIPPLPLFALSYWFESHQPLALLQATPLSGWISIAYVGYLSTLVAFAIWGWLLNQHTSASVTPFALLIPIVGMAAASIGLGESLSLIEWIGAALIVTGLSLSVLGRRIGRWLGLKTRARPTSAL